MPRWKALPDELDPQIREFTSQLRRLVDRSGLNVAAVADRTGYSKTSWERYLNGRLLAPKGAIVALAEVTGTNPVHLTTMWELAERAWSRSEMRHDMTMEAIRISQARAALSEFGAQPGKAKGRAGRKNDGPTGPTGPTGPAVTPGIAGPAGVSPTVPQRPSVPEQPSGPRHSGSAGHRRGAQEPSAGGSGSSGAPSDGPEDVVNSWKLAGYQGPSRTGGRGPGAREGRPEGAATPPSGSPSARIGAGIGTGAGMGVGVGAGAGAGAGAAVGAYGEPPRGGRQGGGSGSGGGRRRVTMFLAGVVGVLVVVAGAFYLTRGGDTADEGAEPKPSPTATASVELPPGVECSGASCVGKDAEAMGCSGELVTTTASAVVGTTTLEVRYSKTCQAAWGRITLGTTGDAVDISAGGAEQKGTIAEAGDTIAYTPMVAVKNAEEAVACATLATGETGCTQ
ncbi:DUF2690 domain-containing protein [Streptomyces sp. NPDC093252]|uniref:helix-turn-helix domain-containing protein n=1 Tax=Streptomyces sp. NPDC093252 TaxID=3154980 RepID=UPI0034407988